MGRVVAWLPAPSYFSRIKIANRAKSRDLALVGGWTLKDNRVIIVDANKQFVEYVTKATARKYIKAKSVTILKRAPQLVLMLPHGVDRVKVYFDKSDSAAKTARYKKRNEKWSEQQQRKNQDIETTANSSTSLKKSGVGT